MWSRFAVMCHHSVQFEHMMMTASAAAADGNDDDDDDWTLDLHDGRCPLDDENGRAHRDKRTTIARVVAKGKHNRAQMYLFRLAL